MGVYDTLAKEIESSGGKINESELFRAAFSNLNDEMPIGGVIANRMSYLIDDVCVQQHLALINISHNASFGIGPQSQSTIRMHLVKDKSTSIGKSDEAASNKQAKAGKYSVVVV